MQNTQATFRPLKNSQKPQKHQVDKNKPLRKLKKFTELRNVAALPRLRRSEYENLYYYPSDDDLPPSNQPAQKLSLSELIDEMVEEVQRCKKEKYNSLENKINTEKVEHEKTAYEVSYEEFIKSDPESPIRFTKDEVTKSCLAEPAWNPLKTLEPEMLMIPEDVLNTWQKKHVEKFASEFDERNSARRMLILNEAELNKTESEVIHEHCLSLVRKMKRHFTFLESKFPNIIYYCCCGALPEEIPGNPPPPLDLKVIVLTMARSGKIHYPAIVIVPTGYLMHPEDYKLLKASLKMISNRWSEYDEFYGVLTNFKMTILLKYNKSERQFYQWQHAVNFNECFLNKHLDKLKDFYKIWFALLFRALEVYSKKIN